MTLAEDALMIANPPAGFGMWALKHWRLFLELAGVAALGVLLLLAKMDASHWHAQSARYEQLWHDEQHARSIEQHDVRLKRAEAAAADAQNVNRVQAARL